MLLYRNNELSKKFQFKIQNLGIKARSHKDDNYNENII